MFFFIIVDVIVVACVLFHLNYDSAAQRYEQKRERVTFISITMENNKNTKKQSVNQTS